MSTSIIAVTFDPYEILYRLTSDLKFIPKFLSTPQADSFKRKIGRLIGATKKVSDLYQDLSDLCKDKSVNHYEWSLLSGRVKMDYIHKTFPSTFSLATDKLQGNLDKDYYAFVMRYGDRLDRMIRPERDFKFNIFSVETLLKSYLARVRKDGRVDIYETPQYLFMRVAAFLWYPRTGEPTNLPLEESFAAIEKVYNELSNGEYIHATPTLFNAGMVRHQLGSCFLMTVQDNSHSLGQSWVDCLFISKESGGLAIDAADIRHSEIGNSGMSKGVIPWIKVWNEILATVDQCMPRGTYIMTATGPTEIQNIKPGDTVFSSDGKRRNVSRLITHKNTRNIPLRELKTAWCENLCITEKHPILSFEGNGKNRKEVISDLAKKNIQPCYINAQELKKGDWVAVPIPEFYKDISHFADEDLVMIGIILNRYCQSLFSKKGPNISLIYNKDEIDEIEFVRNYLSMNKILVFEKEELNTLMLTFSFDKINLMFEGDGEKVWYRILNLPTYRLDKLIFGMFHTSRQNFTFTISCSNEYRAEIVKYIFLRLGVGASVSYVGYNPELNLYPHYEVTICKTNRISNIFPDVKNVCDPTLINYIAYDGKLWFQILENKVSSRRSDILYDLEIKLGSDSDMDVADNYTTSIGQVHNGGKRKGSAAIYLSDHHIDVREFLELRQPQGSEDMRARHLQYALWISDLFMKRVKEDGMWTLFCPNKAKGLNDVWGQEFEMLYKKYEQDTFDGKIVNFERIKARDLYVRIIDSIIQTGFPYILFKDAFNKKTNQKNIGTIRMSNLCCEIGEVTNQNELASCNLASVAVDSCVDPVTKTFDFEKLEMLTRQVVRNMNRVININYYPPESPRIEYSNRKNRPLGIGQQAVADAFALMDLSWLSPEAEKLNKDIAETMYYAAVSESVELAKKYGYYETFPGSPASQGFFQFDLWRQDQIERKYEEHKNAEKFYAELAEHVKSDRSDNSSRYDWGTLRKEMMKHGLYNSLLIALMPTASTAQINGKNEGMECFTEVIYTRTVLSGQFVLVNKYMVDDLSEIGLWKNETITNIIKNQNGIHNIPEEGLEPEVLERLKFLKEKYLTAFEVGADRLADFSAARGEYVCQSQSLNCFVPPERNLLVKYIMRVWKLGLKTGIYYVRQKIENNTINHSLKTIDADVEGSTSDGSKKPKKFVCTDEICTACQ